MVILIDHLKHEILMYIINNVDDSLDPRPLLGWVWQVLVNFGLSFVKYDVACFRPSSTRPQSAWHPVFSCKSAEIKNRRSRCRLMEHVTLRQPCWKAISIGGGGGGSRGSDEFVLPSCGNP